MNLPPNSPPFLPKTKKKEEAKKKRELTNPRNLRLPPPTSPRPNQPPPQRPHPPKTRIPPLRKTLQPSPPLHLQLLFQTQRRGAQSRRLEPGATAPRRRDDAAAHGGERDGGGAVRGARAREGGDGGGDGCGVPCDEGHGGFRDMGGWEQGAEEHLAV